MAEKNGTAPGNVPPGGEGKDEVALAGLLAGELVEEVIRTAVCLEDVVLGLLEDLPESAFPGEENSKVIFEMIAGTVAPAVATVGGPECRGAITLVAAIRERVLADLQTAAEMASEDRS